MLFPIVTSEFSYLSRRSCHRKLVSEPLPKRKKGKRNRSTAELKTLYCVLFPAPPAALLEREPAGRTVSPPWRMLSRMSLSPPRTSRSMAALSSGPPMPWKSAAFVCLPVVGLMSPPSERGIWRLSLAPWPPIFTSAPGNLCSTDWSTPDSRAGEEC